MIRFPKTPDERPGQIAELQQIVQNANAELPKRKNLGEWARSFENVAVMDPLLVLGPVNSKNNYYIVDFRNNATSTARVIYRAADGKIAEIAGLDDGQSELPPFFRPAELPGVLRERSVGCAGGKRIPFGSITFTVDNELVWTPCDQSMSPMQPFYVVHLSGLPPDCPSQVYVRVDGAVFEELSESVAGG
jgi:hypothetical protein